MQVTTSTGETVTLAMPLRFAVLEVRDGMGCVFVRAIGQDQWWMVQSFHPGEVPELEIKATTPRLIQILNAQ